MKRINILVTEQELKQLKKESSKDGISMSEIIRRLIDKHFGKTYE